LRFLILYLAAVDSATEQPGSASSDRIRCALPSGFSRDMRPIRLRTTRSIFGLPGTAPDF
jgi:hypothetical protein